MPKNSPKPPARRRKKRPILTAANADKHRLYQDAVQCPQSELDFVERVFRRLRSRRPVRLREDFCGTAWTCSQWVQRRPENLAIGVDLHAPTLAWARAHNLARLTPHQRRRVSLLRRNVLSPGPRGHAVDAVLAMNFSYWVFHTRPALVEYFRRVRASLVRDGLFFLDIVGGYEAHKLHTERRRCRGFTYVWEQSNYNSIDHRITCHIHFDFKRGPMMRRAFTYQWRLWSIPEVRDCLADAGFASSTAYWEGSTPGGSGDGVFRPQKVGEDCASFIAYIVASR